MSQATTRTVSPASKTATLLALPSAMREPVQNARRYGPPPKGIPLLSQVRRKKILCSDMTTAIAERDKQLSRFHSAAQTLLDAEQRLVDLGASIKANQDARSSVQVLAAEPVNATNARGA